MHSAKSLCLILLMGCCDMSFMVPVGNFVQNNMVYRPVSVVDTPGTGTITNSSNAYDSDKSTFGTWAGPNGSTNYSIFTFTNVAQTKSNSINVLFDDAGGSGGLANPVTFGISLDAGVTYPYSIAIDADILYPSPTNKTLNLPDYIVISNIRMKVNPSYIQLTFGNSIHVYDIWIQ